MRFTPFVAGGYRASFYLLCGIPLHKHNTLIHSSISGHVGNFQFHIFYFHRKYQLSLKMIILEINDHLMVCLGNETRKNIFNKDE